MDWVASPLFGSFKLEGMKRNRSEENRTTARSLPLNVSFDISFCQVSHTPFKNPGAGCTYIIILLAHPLGSCRSESMIQYYIKTYKS